MKSPYASAPVDFVIFSGYSALEERLVFWLSGLAAWGFMLLVCLEHWRDPKQSRLSFELNLRSTSADWWDQRNLTALRQGLGESI